MIKITPIFKNRKAKIAVAVIVALIILALSKSLFVAALVNGWPVSRYAVLRELEKQGGRQVLETLIEKVLISQEARREGVKIADEVVNSQIASIEEVLKKQNLTLEDALKARSQTRKDLEEQIRIQKTIEVILSPKINISDEEINTYFEENKGSYEEKTKIEDVREDIKGLLFQQKLNSEYAKWIEELKNNSDIKYLTNY